MKENVPITDGPVWMVDPTWMEKTGGFARDMTLRDHFAGLALQAMIAHPDSDEDADAREYANGAYVMADAMLKARDGK